MLIGLFGGFYIVPLYALIQERCAPSHRSRIIAANNILNAVFMVASARWRSRCWRWGCRFRSSSWSPALMNAAVAVFIFGLVPEFLMRFLAWLLVHTFYRVRSQGLEHLPDEGPCMIVCNHVSYVDAIVIAASVRRPIRFVMDHRIFRVPVLSFIFRTMRTIPIAPAKEDATMKDRAFATAKEALEAGEIVGIFPEGRLTETGEMNPFRPGVAQIVAATPVPVSRWRCRACGAASSAARTGAGRCAACAASSRASHSSSGRRSRRRQASSGRLEADRARAARRAALTGRDPFGGPGPRSPLPLDPAAGRP